jgi:glucokinase
VRYAIGIDLGGTNIKAARVSEDGTVLDRASGQTRDGATVSTWVTTVRRLAGLQGLDWAEALGATVPVRVMNDAHAGLLGEAWTGAAAGAREAVLLTLGTGVGGAILNYTVAERSGGRSTTRGIS